MGPKRKDILCFLLLLFILPEALIWAGTTGKISGKVLEKSTSELMIGVNIVVEGTSLGGASDLDGNFVILNIPPGTYNIKASMIGYAPVVQSNVRVFIDQTTTVDFVMDPHAVATADVIVIAQREVVRKDVATSVVSFNSEEVKSLPIESISGIVGLQAGVEGGLVIRGGNADQSLFLLDGVTMRDPRNNQPISSVPMSAVSDISVERGGFNAEYGQLQAGMINVVTREGDKNKYYVTGTARYSPPQKKYFGISPFDPNSMWMRPYLDPAVSMVGTKNGPWDIYTQRQYPQFDGWNAISKLTFDQGEESALSPAGAQRLFEWQHRKREDVKSPDYNVDFGIGGPLIPFTDLNEKLGNSRFFLSYRNERDMLLVPLTRPDYYEDVLSLRLTFDISKSMKLDLTGTSGSSLNVAPNDLESLGSSDFLRTPDRITQDFYLQPASVEARLFLDSYYSLATVKNGSAAALFTHILSATSYYEVRLEYVYRTYDTGPIGLRDTTTRYEIFPGYFTTEAPFGFDPLMHTGIDQMWMGGHTSTTRDNSKISSTTLKGNFTSQLDVHNQFKAGLEFIYNDLNLDYGYNSAAFPNENSNVNAHYSPLRAAFYVQDKLEYKGWVANLGLRADYSNPNTQWAAVDTYNKYFFGGSYQGVVIPTEKTKTQFDLSPRLGISHPITEDSKLYFNYGHFRELPTYEQMFRESRGSGGLLKQYGNPNLLMQKTIAYELGYDHSLLDNLFLIQVAAFYRDISDQLENNNRFVSQRNGVDYFGVTNNNYQDIRGFELTIRKTGGQWIAGFINYTYQAVSGGNFGKANVSDDPTVQKGFDDRENSIPYYRNVPTPFARTSISFFTPTDLGKSNFSKLLFGAWNLTLLGDWRSGYPVTWNPNGITLGSPNLQRVDWWNLNLRFSKAIPMGIVHLTFLMDVSNVFNTKRLNLNAFYDSFDEQYYYGSLHLPESPAYKNIPGSDKAGDYRKEGVPYQPMEWTEILANQTNPLPNVIYYEKVTGKYWDFVNNAWAEVDPNRLNQVLNDKAYIDMPNMTSFWFLDPRQIYFGITATIDF
jgi:outer membrane receptor protein involved in Fe transport